MLKEIIEKIEKFCLLSSNRSLSTSPCSGKANTICLLASDVQSLIDELKPELDQIGKNGLSGDVVYYSLKKLREIKIEEFTLNTPIDTNNGNIINTIKDVVENQEIVVKDDKDKKRFCKIQFLANNCKNKIDNLTNYINSEANLLKLESGLNNINIEELSVNTIVGIYNHDLSYTLHSVEYPQSDSLIIQLIPDKPKIDDYVHWWSLRRKEKELMYKKDLDDYNRYMREYRDIIYSKYQMEVRRNEIEVNLYEKRKKAEIDEWQRDKENDRKIAVMKQEIVSELIEKCSETDKLLYSEMLKNCKCGCMFDCCERMGYTEFQNSLKKDLEQKYTSFVAKEIKKKYPYLYCCGDKKVVISGIKIAENTYVISKMDDVRKSITPLCSLTIDGYNGENFSIEISFD